MNKKERDEGNSLIAEFMGGKLIPYSHILKYWMWTEGYNPNYEVKYMENHLRYHESFDWSMEVLKRIEGFKYSSSIVYSQETNSHRVCFPDVGVEVIMKVKIEALWWALIDFIKWYNKNKPIL